MLYEYYVFPIKLVCITRLIFSTVAYLVNINLIFNLSIFSLNIKNELSVD